MRTIAIHNSKGGVGKTTLAANIAYELANAAQSLVNLTDKLLELIEQWENQNG